VKGQALADFMADHPALGTSKLYDDLSDKITEVCTNSWKNKHGNYGASRTDPKGSIVVRVGIILVSPPI